jgi:hypothetical protein
VFDEILGIAEPEQEGLRKMRNRIVAATERLVGDGDIIVRGCVPRLERERLAEQFHRLLVVSVLLHHVAEHDEAAHMVRIAGENVAAETLCHNKVPPAVMSRSRSINIANISRTS